MAKTRVLLEVTTTSRAAFEDFEIASASESEAYSQCCFHLDTVAGLGVDMLEGTVPVPMFTRATQLVPRDCAAIASFGQPTTNPDMPSTSTIAFVEVDRSRVEALRARAGVRVWPDSDLFLPKPNYLELIEPSSGRSDDQSESIFDLARSRRGVDRAPFRAGVSIGTIRELLGVYLVWGDGFRGQNITVGIIDEGVSGVVYPVSGGYAGPDLQPGAASVLSHGSMCSADVLVAAPMAQIYDYRFIGNPTSGGALRMFHEALAQRRRDGTPHLTSNSYSFYRVPPREQSPQHEVWDPTHALHRKIRELTTSGVTTFFAAGNCGEESPSPMCDSSSIGPGRSVHGPNSLADVITIAAVNARHERLGYSSQGPGMFEQMKPDLACYSHFFGNFGPGRPGDTSQQPFDDGTSAAAPLAAGVAALLMCAFPEMTRDELRRVLIGGAVRMGPNGWDRDYGHGIINAAGSYSLLKRYWRPA